MAEVLVKRLKFIDELGIHLSLTQLFGRAAPGERVKDHVPQRPGGPTWMLMGALGLAGLSTPWVFDGPIDGVAFEVYMGHVLGSTLQPGDIVVMGNLSAHKVSAIEPAITARCPVTLDK